MVQVQKSTEMAFLKCFMPSLLLLMFIIFSFSRFRLRCQTAVVQETFGSNHSIRPDFHVSAFYNSVMLHKYKLQLENYNLVRNCMAAK